MRLRTLGTGSVRSSAKVNLRNSNTKRLSQSPYLSRRRAQLRDNKSSNTLWLGLVVIILFSSL